jgi:phosphate:Na+ symporter
MSKITLENLRLALEAFYMADSEKAAQVLATESKIDRLEKKILSWLSQIQQMSTPEEIETLRSMLFAASNLERIGDHAENIAEFSTHKGIRRKDMHSGARDSLHELSGKVIEIMEMTVGLFENYSLETVEEICRLEEIIDDLAKECIDKYIERQEAKVRDPRGGIVLTNVVGDLERCGDHAVNLAKNMRHYHEIVS